MGMVEIMTNPDKFKEYLRVAIHSHEQQKKAKRDYYHRNKEAISQRRKDVYVSKKKGVAEGVVQGV